MTTITLNSPKDSEALQQMAADSRSLTATIADFARSMNRTAKPKISLIKEDIKTVKSDISTILDLLRQLYLSC